MKRIYTITENAQWDSVPVAIRELMKEHDMLPDKDDDVRIAIDITFVPHDPSSDALWSCKVSR
jgi:hypothetical protein